MRPAAIIALVAAPALALNGPAPPSLTRRAAAAMPAPMMTRRAVAATAAALLGCRPAPSEAAPFSVEAAYAAVPTARVAKWPALEYLEPIYELKLSLDSLGAIAIGDPARYPVLQKRLNKFFNFGGPMCEANYYKGLSVQYINQIGYDDLDEFVQADKLERQASMDAAIEGMRSLLTRLDLDENSGAEDEIAMAGVAADAQAAQMGITRWLKAVPADDVLAVDALYKAVRAADEDADGKLSKAELATLPKEQSSVWLKKVALVGE